MNSRKFIDKTQTRLIPLVYKEFLPEIGIHSGDAIRSDYEKLRIVYELQRDIASEIKINAVLNRILDRTSEILNYDHGVILAVADVFDALTSSREYPKYDETRKPHLQSENVRFRSSGHHQKKSRNSFRTANCESFQALPPQALVHSRGTHFDPDYTDGMVGTDLE